MAGKEYPLSLVIKAIDRATEPLRRVNRRISEITAPVRRVRNSLRALSIEAGVPRLLNGFRAIGHAVGRVGSAIWSLSKRFALLGVAAGYVFYRMLSGTIKAGDDLATFSKRVDMTADAFAQLQFAAAQSDVEAEQFTKGMDYFNKAIGEAKAGTGALTTLLKKTSPPLLKQLRGTKDVEEALKLLTDRFVKIKDPTRRAALSAAAFGRSGQQIGVWLSDGGEKIDAQRKKYAELSGSQQEFADNSARLDNTLRETSMAFAGLRNVALAKMMPALEKIAKWFTSFIVKHRDSIAAWAERAGKAIEEWVDKGGLDDVMKFFKDIFGLVKSAKSSIDDATVSISNIDKAFSSLYSKTEMVRTVFSAFTDPLMRLPDLVRAFIGPLRKVPDLLSGIASPFIALGDIAVTQIEMVRKAFSDLIELVTSGWNRAGPILEKIASVASPAAGLFRVGSDLFGGARPDLGAERLVAGSRQVVQQKSHVTVDINGLPRGARVTKDPASTAPLDLSLGYSMVTQ